MVINDLVKSRSMILLFSVFRICSLYLFPLFLPLFGLIEFFMIIFYILFLAY
jgi:hypothetical protein